MDARELARILASDSDPCFTWPDASLPFNLATVAKAPSWTEQAIQSGEPGYLVAVGNFNGYEIARSNDKNATAYPLGGIPYPNESPFFLRSNGGSGSGRVLFFKRGSVPFALLALLASGASSAGAGGSASGGPVDATQSISLGSFTPAIAGSLLFDNSAGANDVVVYVAGDGNNAAAVFIAETQAKAALLGAAGGGLRVFAAGIRSFLVPAGSQCWGASAAGTMIVDVQEDTP